MSNIEGLDEGIDQIAERQMGPVDRTGAPGSLPRPGERHNASGIPVSDAALAVLLAGTRVAEVTNPCEEPDCESCNELHLIWWDCCNALSRGARILLQTTLRADGYGLPDAPWEDVVDDHTADERNMEEYPQ